MSRHSASSLLLLALPLVVLVVPQGTTARTLVPELGFIGMLLLTVVVSVSQAAWLTPPLAMRRSQFQPLLLLALVHFLLLNPMWSLWQGNDGGRVVMTVLPFVMLGVYYLLALLRLPSAAVGQLVVMLAVSGVVLGLIVVGNFFLGGQAGASMRSTGIEGERTLTLPLLPMGGVLVAAWALVLPSGKWAQLSAVAALLMVVAIIMTVTRAMLAAYLVGSLLTMALMLRHGDGAARRRIRARAVLGFLLVLALGAPLLAQWLERLDPTSEGDVGTILGRVDEYTAFLDAFLASPLLGRGMGYLASYPSDFDWTLRDSGITVCHSHLFFLLGTGGMVSAALYYGLLAGGCWQLLKKAHFTGSQPFQLGVVAGMAGAVVAGVAFTLTSTTFTALSYNLFLAIFLYCASTDWATQ